MNILLVELDLDEISIDEPILRNHEKESFIYEHLLHYCSKFYPLPTITVRVDLEKIYVIRRYQYVMIARELMHKKIRAIIDNSSQSKFVQTFLQKPSVKKFDWEAVMKEEENLVEYVWYVFFFKMPLSKEQKVAFENQIVEFFSQIKLPELVEKPKNRIQNLSYPYSGLCAEFQAYVPGADERWYAKSRDVLRNFHLNSVPISSFQGTKCDRILS